MVVIVVMVVVKRYEREPTDDRVMLMEGRWAVDAVRSTVWQHRKTFRRIPNALSFQKGFLKKKAA